MGRRKRGDRLRARHRWDRVVGPGWHSDAHGSPRPEAGLLADQIPDCSVAEELAADHGPAGPTERRRWALSGGLATIVLCVLGLGAGLWWWSAASSPPEVGPAQPHSTARSTARASGAGAGETTSSREADGSQTVVVHIAGAVAKPGVYRLDKGSRIHDAISAAGGALPEGEADRLNLASQVEDGARIAVPRRGEAAEAGVGSGAKGGDTRQSSAGSKVNLNIASAEELAQLPRVGPVLAQRIVEYREQHGRFSSPEDLDAVPGIGAKMLESLLPLVSV
ncbi:helix-hairpin-helix domain-containing protein [Sinomonas terrae]|uniref:Helix-hairpin-helix domain-containing protein n=1 Tax=Sinomonas terrae TaxID=2908838 RepID=A0ABS9U0Q9_9MICC|nr:helix-hairpin-helix domain-containing protein [Sinomonas terrae]MCH6470298.1 helix-hairpin-helix domain-containing protein [Sinomonas terrae]